MNNNFKDERVHLLIRPVRSSTVHVKQVDHVFTQRFAQENIKQYVKTVVGVHERFCYCELALEICLEAKSKVAVQELERNDDQHGYGGDGK